MADRRAARRARPVTTPAQCVVRGHRGSERVVARAGLLAPRVTKTRAVPPSFLLRVRTRLLRGEKRGAD